MNNPECLPMTTQNPEIIVCGCKNGNECKGTGVMMAMCSATGQCMCGNTTCQQGEVCQHVGMADSCTCHGGNACTNGQTCCAKPAGCVDLTNDVNNCGACGRVCPAGFNCQSGGCGCGANDANCNAGAPQGTYQCVQMPGADMCKCGNTQCTIGQRCLPDGTCG
jgi:hypothetical protein